MNSRLVIMHWDSYEGFMYRHFTWLAVRFGGLMLAIGFVLGGAL